MAAKRSDSPFPFGVCLLSFILTWTFLAAVARPICHLVGADIESTPGASDRLGIGVILCAAGVGVLIALRAARRRN
ncbi:hypothetical protein [Planctellipticum variicoloris]|uniref:hypothetical protein n=1 Tax=Planctellipticum variicoloris TaxID=3064265 RepID=UPI003013646E|nr:hypothetical protein SH412_004269 [Planctomycetaceae bacterium SH412]